jgi:hypothetical protein
LGGWAARQPNGPRRGGFRGPGEKESDWIAGAEPAQNEREEGGGKRPGWAARRRNDPKEEKGFFYLFFPILAIIHH